MLDGTVSRRYLRCQAINGVIRMVATDNEFPPCTWSELTEYEKREATSRGFPREAGVRYVTKRRYDQDSGELSLVRWTGRAGDSYQNQNGAFLKRELKPEWRVHTPLLLQEIGTNQSLAIMKIPLNIFAGLLGQVAERALTLNDPELTDLMLRMALIEQTG